MIMNSDDGVLDLLISMKGKRFMPLKISFPCTEFKFSVLLPSDDFIFIAGKLSEVVLLSLAMAFFFPGGS